VRGEGRTHGSRSNDIATTSGPQSQSRVQDTAISAGESSTHNGSLSENNNENAEARAIQSLSPRSSSSGLDNENGINYAMMTSPSTSSSTDSPGSGNNAPITSNRTFVGPPSRLSTQSNVLPRGRTTLPGPSRGPNASAAQPQRTHMRPFRNLPSNNDSSTTSTGTVARVEGIGLTQTSGFTSLSQLQASSPLFFPSAAGAGDDRSGASSNKRSMQRNPIPSNSTVIEPNQQKRLKIDPNNSFGPSSRLEDTPDAVQPSTSSAIDSLQHATPTPALALAEAPSILDTISLPSLPGASSSVSVQQQQLQVIPAHNNRTRDTFINYQQQTIASGTSDGKFTQHHATTTPATQPDGKEPSRRRVNQSHLATDYRTGRASVVKDSDGKRSARIVTIYGDRYVVGKDVQIVLTGKAANTSRVMGEVKDCNKRLCHIGSNHGGNGQPATCINSAGLLCLIKKRDAKKKGAKKKGAPGSCSWLRTNVLPMLDPLFAPSVPVSPQSPAADSVNSNSSNDT
jgi:hypothetical protein